MGITTIARRIPRVFQQAVAPGNSRLRDIDTSVAGTLKVHDGTGFVVPQDDGSGGRMDVRIFTAPARQAGINLADGLTHPLSTLYADAAAAAAAFPRTATFRATLGWQPIQVTEELFSVALQEACEAAWPIQKDVYIPQPAAASSYLMSNSVALRTGQAIIGDRWASYGTCLKARSNFSNKLSDGSGDNIQALLRTYNPVGGINNTCRVFMDHIWLDGNNAGSFITDARISLGTPTTLTSTIGGFDASWTGAHAVIPNAGLNGGPLGTTVTYVNANTLTLAVAASVAITADQNTFCSRIGISGTRFVLQQPSKSGINRFDHFSTGIGLWVEGQDSKWDRISSFNDFIGLRLRDAQFQHMDAFNAEVWGFCAILLDGVTIGGSSCWFDKLHLENQSSLVDNTYAIEVARGFGNSFRDIHFSEFSTTTKHNFMRISGINTQCGVDIVNFRNQSSSTDDDHYALRDYASGIHYTFNQVGRNWGGYRSAMPTQSPGSWTNYGWAQDYAGPLGQALRVMGGDASLAMLDISPGTSLTGSQQIWRDTNGVRSASVRPDGALSSRLVSSGNLQNLLKHTEDVTQWTLAHTGAADAVVTANVAGAPDGTATAQQIDFNASASNMVRSVTGSPDSQNKSVVFGAWLKSNTGATGTVNMRFFATTIRNQVMTVTTEWKFYWFTAVVPNGETGQIIAEFIQDGVAGRLMSILFWHPQLERDVTIPGQYLRTRSIIKSTPQTGITFGTFNLATLMGVAFGVKTAYSSAGLANGVSTNTTVTVPGVTNDGTWFCMIFYPTLPVGWQATAQVTGVDTVTVTFTNNSGGSAGLSSGTIAILAFKAS